MEIRTGIGEIPDSWRVVHFGDAAAFTKKPRNLRYSEYDGIPFVPMELIPVAKLFSQTFTLKTNSELKSGVYFEIGDLLLSKITPSFENGKQCIIAKLPIPFGVATTEVIPIKAVDDVSDLYYLFYYLLLPAVRISLAGKMQGTTGRQRLNKATLVSLQIPLPPLPEQRAIADILQTLQEAKFTRQREIDLERERKAALMHHLFSSGTKAEPRKQTDIGEIPESWEVVSFGDVAAFTKKPRNLRYSEQDGIPFVPMELIPVAKLFSQTFTLKTDSELKSGIYFEVGDLLLSKITPSFENGKQCIVKGLPTPFGFATTEVIPIKAVDDVSDLSYLFYYLLRPEVRILLAGKMQGTTGRQRLNKSALVNLQIPLPPLPEQQTIANIFRAIDEKTAALEQEIEHLDQLFHTMLEELMTGKRSAVPLIDAETLKQMTHVGERPET